MMPESRGKKKGGGGWRERIVFFQNRLQWIPAHGYVNMKGIEQRKNDKKRKR